MSEMLLFKSLVLIAVLSSSYASEREFGYCEDEKVKVLRELVEIQREKGDALKEMTETQRQKDEEFVALIRSVGKVEKLQPLEESQNKLSLALNKLEGRLDQGLDVIQTKMDTQMDEMKTKLEAMQVSYDEVLRGIEDKLTATLSSFEEVLQRVEDLERQVKSGSTEVRNAVCLPPFEPVGDDCVHWNSEKMTWEDARRYCQGLGADLFIPTVKEGFELEYGSRSMSDRHPPVFDFLHEKSRSIYGWIGASVDDKNKATWTSGEELKRGQNRLLGDDHLKCIAAYVHEETYAVWTVGCDMTISTVLCQ